MKKIKMPTETKLLIFQSMKNEIYDILDKMETLIKEECVYIQKDVADSQNEGASNCE